MTKKLKAYSTTAANNNLAPPDGWPENMAISAVNNSARENMARYREWYEDSVWVDYGDTIVSSTASTIVFQGDVTGRYVTNRAIRVNQSDATLGYVLSSSYAAPNTTVNVTGFTVAGPTQVELSGIYTSKQLPQVALTASSMTMNTGKILLRTTAGVGAVEEGAPGNGLTLAAGVLDTPTGSVIQRVFLTYTTVTTNNVSQITPNGSAPTTANGVQIFSQAFVPKQASSTIVIRGILQVGGSGAPSAICAAVFSGTTFLTGTMVTVGGNGSTSPLQFMWQEAAGSTNSRTYSVNYGPASAITASINSGQFANTYNFGAGGMISWLEILEMKA